METEGDCYRLCESTVVLSVRARPGASRSEIVGVRGAELWVKVAAPAERGRANRELLRTLAAELGLAPSAIEIASGATSPRKRLVLPREAWQPLRRLLSRLGRG